MDKLLHYYQQELGRLRDATRQYAAAHPNTAAALELESGISTDPEVERLLQSVALLNAATQKSIEDGRSDFHRALLQSLQPQYLRTIPASGIIQVDASAARPNEISSVNCLPRGTLFRSGANKFATAYDVCISPIAITDAKLQAVIDLPSALRLSRRAASALVITLKSTANSVSFNPTVLRKLRICLNGEPEMRAGLFDAILMNSLCVCLEVDTSWTLLDRSPFTTVGKSPGESLLPLHPGPQSQRIMTEFFHLSQKFGFIDLDLEAISLSCPPGSKQVALHIVLPGFKPQLRKTSAANFVLGCTPAVNLFPQTAVPIRLDGRSEAYPVVLNQSDCEMYGIDNVAVMSRAGDVPVPPFHGMDHTTAGPYWQVDEQEGPAIRFVDREQRPFKLTSGTVTVRLTCMNSNPSPPPARLTTEASTAGCSIRFLNDIAPANRFPDPGPLCEVLYAEETTLPVLRKLLELHGCKFSGVLKRLDAKSSTAWLEHPMGRVHMLGTEFTLLIDELAMQAQSIHAFGEVLAGAIADKLPENRFVELRMANERGQILYVAKPQAGTRPLV